MSDETVDAYFGPGTVPESVVRAVEDQVAGAHFEYPPPSPAQVETFFGDMAELIKRAGGEP